MKMRGFFTLLMLLSAAWLSAQNTPEGIWKTIDDKTGEAKSQVEIFKKDGKFHGKVVKLLKSSPDKKCDKCPGDRKNKPLVGMLVVENLQAHDYYWKHGTILDPENGNEYGCSVWFEKGKPDELKVRGKHWSGIFRTQTWYRVK